MVPTIVVNGKSSFQITNVMLPNLVAAMDSVASILRIRYISSLDVRFMIRKGKNEIVLVKLSFMTRLKKKSI